jgi:hypothetical protein
MFSRVRALALILTGGHRREISIVAGKLQLEATKAGVNCFLLSRPEIVPLDDETKDDMTCHPIRGE